MATDSDSVCVGYAASHDFIHRGSSACDKLLYISIVGLYAFALADYWEGRSIEDGITASEPNQRTRRTDSGESVR
jgi:hypothetical protein